MEIHINGTAKEIADLALELQNRQINSIATKDLVCELAKREAVETHTAEPYTDLCVEVNGPATVLIVTD